MILLGWAGRVLVDIAGYEQILIVLGNQLLHPIFAGIILAAVLSAIMSTADSQLLVAASSISYDLKDKNENHSLFNTRITVVLICLIAVLMAIFVDKSIYSRVLFAFSAIFKTSLYFFLEISAGITCKVFEDFLYWIQ